MSDSNNPETHNAREYSRVETHIPLEVRLVPQDEQPHIRSRIEDELYGLTLPADVEDPLLLNWLKLLNMKLDLLLGMMPVKPKETDERHGLAEDISGGGLSFFSKKEFSHNDILEIKLSPKLLKYLFIYGRVVQSNRRDDGFITAIAFISLDDAVRDEIIKFVFEREREILRERRRT